MNFISFLEVKKKKMAVNTPIDTVDGDKHMIPVVSLLVQGSPACLDQVAFYVQNKMPVVVLRGSGGLADMVGYAYDELSDRSAFYINRCNPELGI